MIQSITRLFSKKSPQRPPSAGIYHYAYAHPVGESHVHLRVEADGSGFMLVNANRIFHMNPTALFMAYLKLEGCSPEQILTTFTRAYDVDPASAQDDYARFEDTFHALVEETGKCPLCDLHLETLPPMSCIPSAPYRMDLAITYRCNNNCSHCYNARSRNFPELSTIQWKQVIDQLWAIGIPHIVFTGGEPTLREDLPELIQYAQSRGQITGINTNGRRLKDPVFLQQLVDAGLDHVQITFESHVPAIHDTMQGVKGAWDETLAGIRNVLQSPLYMMTNTTMLATNQASIAETLEFLAELGVPTVGLNALIHSGRGAEINTGLSESEVEALLEIAKEKTGNAGQRLIWYTPTQYCHFNPILHEVGAKGCSAALYNMCVEPNGDVLPCQSYYQSVGNLLTDQWDAIWRHPLCVSIRERKYAPNACQSCSLLDECGAGCPLAYQNHAYQEPIPFIEIVPDLEMEWTEDEIPD